MVRKELIKKLEELKEEFKIVDRKEIISPKKKFVDVKTYQCILNNGKIVQREQIFKNNKVGHAVIVVPLTDNLETILVLQPRVFTSDGVGIEVPAGYIEEYETSEDAALRELKEETGYVPDKLIHLISYYQDQGISAAYNHAYLALGCKRLYDQDLDNDEYINYLECSFEDVVSLLDAGIINDANSVIAINATKKVLGR